MKDGLACGTEQPSVRSHVAFSDACMLLSVLLGYPGYEQVKGIMNGSIAQDFLDIAAELGLPSAGVGEGIQNLEPLSSACSCEDVLHSLRREYTRLFDHPVQPVLRPYESLFLSESASVCLPPLFVNDAALDAQRIYRLAGLACSDAESLSADHIATELEFLSVLHLRVAKEAIGGQSEEGIAVTALLEEFDRIHAMRWFGRFFESLAREGEGFYRAVGHMGVMFGEARVWSIE